MKIALIGRMQSGKTTIADFLYNKSCDQERMPCILKFAKPIYDCQQIFNPTREFPYYEKKNREFLQELGYLARKCFTPRVLVELFLKNLVSVQEKYNKYLDADSILDVICDDVRVISEFEAVKKEGFITIGVKSNEKKRKERNPYSFTNINHTTEIEVDILIEKCDIIIENNTTLDDFLTNANTALAVWLMKWTNTNPLYKD